MSLMMSSGSGSDEAQELSEINITPFIDVMLVLLIIFMIAAPLATVDIMVDLPSATAAPSPPRSEAPLTLTIKPDGTLLLQETEVTRDTLADALETASDGDKEQRLFIHADQDLSYGHLMGVVESVRAAGFLKVAFVGLESTSP